MITIHIDGVHRQFSGDDAASQAKAWASTAARECDDEERHYTITGTALGSKILKHLKKIRRPIDTVELANTLGVSRSSCARILTSFAALGDVIDHGQANRKQPKFWEAA